MRISALFLGIFLCLAGGASAQPAEYNKIYEIVKAPDELISAEFNVIGTNRIFSVSLKSSKNVFEIDQLFRQGADLNLISLEFMPEDEWRLILTNREASKLDYVKFKEIAEIAWNSRSNKELKIILTSATVAAITYPANAQEYNKNLEMARAAGMKVANSKSDNSYAEFKIILNPEEYGIPSGFENPDNEFSKELKQFATIADSNELRGFSQYTLKMKMSDFVHLIQALTKFEKAASYIKLETFDAQTATVEIKTTNKAADTQKLKFLQNLIDQHPIAWAKEGYNTKVPVMTGFETDFSKKITIIGISPKSGLIFSHFMPMVERTRGLSHPFFSRGTNKETRHGKFMQFKIDCGW